MYTIISRDQCNFCDLAKSMMSSKKLGFVEYNVQSTSSKWVLTLIKKTDLSTLPQIFDNKGNLIGGYTELQEHLLND